MPHAVPASLQLYGVWTTDSPMNQAKIRQFSGKTTAPVPHKAAGWQYHGTILIAGGPRCAETRRRSLTQLRVCLDVRQ